MESIKINKMEAYSIKVGDHDFGIFNIASEWEGFKKVVNHKDEFLFLHSTTHPILDLLNIGDAFIVSGSKSIIDKINEAKTK